MPVCWPGLNKARRTKLRIPVDNAVKERYVKRLSFLSLLRIGLVEGDLTAIRERVERHLAREGPTLDIPCGPGLLADLFAGGDYVGADSRRADVDAAREKRPGIYICTPLDRIDVPDGRFAQVLALGLLDSLGADQARQTVREVARVTAQDGRLLAFGALPVPAGAIVARVASQLSGALMRRTAAETSALLAPYFAVVSCEPFRSGLVRRVTVVARRTAAPRG
jgi:SAM-dependent methyltransferase